MLLTFSTSSSLPQRYSTYYRYLLVRLTLPIQRGIHDIHRPFAFRSNPGFIFHDSPGFETGDEKQLQEVLSFMEEKAKARNVDDQLHAIWSVSLSHHTYWTLMFSSAVKVLFCSEQCSASITMETEFFETARAGKGFYRPVIQASD